MTKTIHAAVTGWEKIPTGSHICSIFRTEEEQFNPVLPFFWQGFGDREKCMYVFHEELPAPIFAEFDHVQTYPEQLSQTRQIEVLSHDEVYTKDGIFDPDGMIAHFAQNAADAQKQGYTGMRVSGEMSWVRSTDTPIDLLLEYETKLNNFFPTSRVSGICQYDEHKFSQDVLLNVIRTHPYVILYGKLYENKYFYTDPRYFDASHSPIPEGNYETVVSIFLDDAPLIG